MGCPALAGIDPTMTERDTAREGLPRTRGDRPYPDGTQVAAVAVAPHSRG